MTEFNLRRWASRDHVFVGKNGHDMANYSGLVNGRQEGFRKCVKLAREWANEGEATPRKEVYCITDLLDFLESKLK